MEKIPFDEFGGNGRLLHFAGPNAYPPRVFKRFLGELAQEYRVTAVHHRPLWPGTKPDEMQDWRLIAEDMIRFFDQQGMRQAIGVGHSLGAVTTALAATLRPELFGALVLIDPVFMPPNVIEMMQANPAAAWETPLVKGALRRRNRWPSREAAFDHFRGKRVFGGWSDAALRDFVAEGLTIDAETAETTLTFSREWEAQFYANVPTWVWEMVPQLTQPTLAVRAANSDTLYPPAWALWQEKQPAATFVEVPKVGHMLTAEQPKQVAQTVRAWRAMPQNHP